jgi:hypothetical protein
MYFMFPEVLSNDASEHPFAASHFRATVGVRNGSAVFAFSASDPLVRRMAKNILGVDHDPQESDLVDVFKEAANMIAGNLVTELAFDPSVSLEVPAVQRTQVPQKAVPGSCSFFSLDDEPFMVSVQLPDA